MDNSDDEIGMYDEIPPGEVRDVPLAVIVAEPNNKWFKWFGARQIFGSAEEWIGAVMRYDPEKKAFRQYLRDEGDLPPHEGNEVTVTLNELAANIDYHMTRSFKDHVTVTHEGKPFAYYIAPDEYRALVDQSDRNRTVFGPGEFPHNADEMYRKAMEWMKVEIAAGRMIDDRKE